MDKSEILFEQYKLCVEMADRVSQRRSDNNKLFLAINSSLISIFGLIIAYDSGNDNTYFWSLAITFSLPAIIINYTWYRLIWSFRQLNTAKFKVIGELESQLPASPFYDMEWNMLGQGKDKKLYTPFSELEQFIPMLFCVGYLVLIIINLLKFVV